MDRCLLDVTAWRGQVNIGDEVVIISSVATCFNSRHRCTAPWGQQFFAEVVLREPRWVVNILTYSPEQHQAVHQELDAATHPAVQALAQLARSSYPAETKERMAAFVEALAAHTLSLPRKASGVSRSMILS